MFPKGAFLRELSTGRADGRQWLPSPRLTGAYCDIVRTSKKGKSCSLFVVFFRNTFDNPSFINTGFLWDDSFVHDHATSAQGMNHELRRTGSSIKNIYVLIVSKAWHGNWKFKGQKFYFVFLIFSGNQEANNTKIDRNTFSLSLLHIILSWERCQADRTWRCFLSKGEYALVHQLIEMLPYGQKN